MGFRREEMKMTKETSVNGQVEKKNEQGALDSLTGYYTKTQVDARLNLKADITDTELKKYDMYPDPTNHPGWIVSFRQRRMGMVTVTINMAGYPKTHTLSYANILTGIPECFRPAKNLFFMFLDNNNKARCVGIYHSGLVRVYDSSTVGCYGTMTYIA